MVPLLSQCMLPRCASPRSGHAGDANRTYPRIQRCAGAEGLAQLEAGRDLRKTVPHRHEGRRTVQEGHFARR